MWPSGAVGKGKQKSSQRVQMSTYKIKNSDELMYIIVIIVNNTAFYI